MLKSLANFLAACIVLPAVAAYRLSAAIIGVDRAFPGWSQLFALAPGASGELLRRAFYRLALKHCDATATIGFGTTISHPTASIGRHVHIGNYCVLGGVTIEDDALIASHVSILNGMGQHSIERLDVTVRNQPGHFAEVTIGRDSWIGERSVIGANVGRQAVIGAGAVVTRPIPDFAIAVGVPARVLRFRENQASTTLLVEDTTVVADVRAESAGCGIAP